MNSNIATIPKEVSGGEELVVVKRKEFEAFKKWQEQLRDVLATVARGRAEYKHGKTVKATSPKKFR